MAGDYTRFAYQNGYILRAYTIPAQYYLYTDDEDGEQYIIAGLDGSINHEVQLDNLEFLANTYDATAYNDIVTFTDMADSIMNNTIAIRYRNLKESNTAINVQILLGTTMLYNSSAFANPNYFTIYFDYSAFNVTGDDMFTLLLTPAGGDTLTKPFTIGGQTAKVPSGLVIVVSILITFFALTLASTSLTFGWFGILIEVLNIAWLGFGTDSIYRTWVLGLNVIVLLAMIVISLKSSQTSIGAT